MAIVDPGVVVFNNEELRPLAEKLRSLKAITTAINDEFSTVHSANCPNDSGELLIDNRQVDGVTQVSGEDINDLINLSNTIETALSSTLNESLLSKFAVRSLQV